MDNRHIMVSKDKMNRHMKKKWWILVVLIGVGVIAFCCGVFSNTRTANSTQEIFKYKKILLFDSHETYKNSNYISDFKVFITTEEFANEIYGKEKGVSVEVEKLSDSNCLSILVTATEGKKAKSVAEKVVQEGIVRFHEVYSQVDISEIESICLPTEKVSVMLVQLKDVIMLIAPLLIGIFCVYLLIILDDCIYTREELEYFLDMPVYEYEKEECLNLIKRLNDMAVIVGRDLDEMASEIKGIEVLSEFLRKKDSFGKPKILIVKKCSITVKELEAFMRIIDKDIEKSLKIFMIAL